MDLRETGHVLDFQGRMISPQSIVTFTTTPSLSILMGTTDALIEDEKLRKKSKKRKEKEGMPKSSALTNEKNQKDKEGVGSAKELGRAEELKKVRRKEEKNKNKNKTREDDMEGGNILDEETNAALKEGERKRKRSIKKNVAEPDISLQPRKKSKKSDDREKTKSKNVGLQPVEVSQKKDQYLEPGESSDKLKKKEKRKNKTRFPDPEQDKEISLSDQAIKGALLVPTPWFIVINYRNQHSHMPSLNSAIRNIGNSTKPGKIGWFVIFGASSLYATLKPSVPTQIGLTRKLLDTRKI